MPLAEPVTMAAWAALAEGSVMRASTSQEALRRVDDRRDTEARHVFERARIADRNARRAEATDRDRQRLGHRRHHFGAEARGAYRLVHDEQPPGASRRGQHRVAVPGPEA